MGFPGALFSSFYRSFPLMGRNQRIKAKMNGPPHSRPKCLTLRSRSTFCEGKRQAPLGEGQAFSSSFRQAPLPFWPGPRALPSLVLANPHTPSIVFTFTLNNTLPPPTLIAGPDPQSPTLWGPTPVVASRHREQSERLPLGIAPASLRVIARNEAIQKRECIDCKACRRRSVDE